MFLGYRAREWSTSLDPGNKLRVEDRAAHDWYRFVLSFRPHLIRTYTERFGLSPGLRYSTRFAAPLWSNARNSVWRASGSSAIQWHGSPAA